MLVPTFHSIEAANLYAQRHEPLKRALENCTVDGTYARTYGDRAALAAKMCWAEAKAGNESAFWRQQRALSSSLPAHLFEYGRKS